MTRADRDRKLAPGRRRRILANPEDLAEAVRLYTKENASWGWITQHFGYRPGSRFRVREYVLQELRQRI
jgi:hypothetical protein